MVKTISRELPGFTKLFAEGTFGLFGLSWTYEVIYSARIVKEEGLPFVLFYNSL